MTKVRENHGPKTAESPIKTSSSQLAGNYWLDTTETRLEAIAAEVHRSLRPLRSVEAISRRVERELHRTRI